jgi:autotransporter-associated beta strand protein
MMDNSREDASMVAKSRLKINVAVDPTGSERSLNRGSAFVTGALGVALTIVWIGVDLSSIRAATVTWDNDLSDGDDTNFNNGANWSGGSGVPGAADNATFNGAEIVNPNLTASATIQGITFPTATSSGYTIAANPTFSLTLTNPGTASPNIAISALNTSGSNTISSNMILGGASATVANFSQAAGGTLVVSGNISSTNAISGITLSPGGTYTLSGTNSYSGTTVLGGTLNLGSDSALGTGALVIGGNSVLDASGDDRTLSNAVSLGNFAFSGTHNLTLGAVPTYTIPRVITLNSTTGKTLTFGTLTNVINADSSLTVNGAGNKLIIDGLQLAPDSATAGRIFTTDGSGILEITGPVTNGAASFNHEMRYFGTGKIILSGASTYAGTTRVISGTMQLTGSLNPATWLRIGQIGAASGKFILGGASGAVDQTVSRFDNPQNHGVLNVLAGGATNVSILTINSITTDAFNGLIGGTALNENNIGITKSNTGTLTFTAPNTYSGGTVINGGTLLVNNTSGSGLGTGPVEVHGGTLGGTGAISGTVTINSGGTLAPGASIESLDVGSLVLNTGSILSMELGAPGISDLINVTTSGGLNIAGGSVSLTNAGGMAAGTYKLIDYLDSFTGNIVNLGTPTGPAGFSYALQDNATNTSIDLVVTSTGDYNGDHITDAADYVLWRKTPNAFGGDPAGYNIWRSKFGTSTGSGSTLASHSVPEPGTMLLLMAGIAFTRLDRRR